MSRRNRHRHNAGPFPVDVGANHPAPLAESHSGLTGPAADAQDHSVRPVEGETWQEAVAGVEAYLRQGKSKPALWRAKQVHKHWGTPESERLLLRVYAARIEELTSRGLASEAEALLKSLRERYPQAAQALMSTELRLGAPCSSLGGLLKRLVDPACTPDETQAIEDAIRRNLKDPADLAHAVELPADHPLKREATALVRAFEKVTSGSALDEDMALPEISRRSPLAPWKVLVRAIAHFYRKEDEACLACLDRLPAQAAVTRLASALWAVLARDGKGRAELSPALRALADRIGGDSGKLADTLRNLDARYGEKKAKPILRAIEEAIRVCHCECPELLVRLRQRVSVRSFMADLEPERVHRAMGGPSRKDAFFWRLLAQATELRSAGHVEAKVLVCELLEHFRVHAIHEGRFADCGPEVVALYGTMLDLQESVPPDVLASVHRRFAAGPNLFQAYYTDQPEEIRTVGRRAAGMGALLPEKLYERICEIAPDADMYRRWFHRLRKKDGGYWQQAEEVASRWQRAFPKDVRPVLNLIELAEERGALKKALGWVEQAERLDGLHAGVRDARMRLWTATAMRHLKQRKPRLLEKDLEALDALPSMRDGDRPAFLSALRWVCAVGTGNLDQAGTHLRQVAERLGSSVASCFLLEMLSAACGGIAEIPADTGSAALEAGALAKAAGRALLLAVDVGLPARIPEAYESEIAKDLAGKPATLDTAALCAIAEAAVSGERHRLGYVATAHGLQRTDAPCGRLLLLRARCLPPLMFERMKDLQAAAIAFAREARDGKTLDEALGLDDGRRARSRYSPYAVSQANLDKGEALKILGIEKVRKDFLGSPDRQEVWSYHGRPDARLHEFDFPGFEGDYEDDPDAVWDGDLEPDEYDGDEAPEFGAMPALPKGLSPKLASLLAQALLMCGPGIDDPEELLERLQRKDPKLAAKLLDAMIESAVAMHGLPPEVLGEVFGSTRRKGGRKGR